MAGYGYGYGGYSNYNGAGHQLDTEGRKRPIVAFSHVMKSEIAIDRGHSPFSGEYRHKSPAKAEHYKDYGLVHDRTVKVDEFLTKIQNEASRLKFGPLSASYWKQRQTPNSTSYHGAPGYGDYSDFSHKEQHKPSGNGKFNDYYCTGDKSMQPSMITTGGWARPSHAMWSTPPDAPLSEPTNDIGKAVRYLEEAAGSPSVKAPHSQFGVPISTGHRRDAYGETIDSREAARRYGNLKTPAWQKESYTNTILKTPAWQKESYTNTIDSREAARKYGGRTL